jgi:hypothetical protein
MKNEDDYGLADVPPFDTPVITYSLLVRYSFGGEFEEPQQLELTLQEYHDLKQHLTKLRAANKAPLQLMPMPPAREGEETGCQQS